MNKGPQLASVAGRPIRWWGPTVLALCASLASPFGVGSPARADTPPASYFGMHYARVGDGAWPQASIGSVRLWDTGTSWADIQPARNQWRWDTLDTAVATAEANGAEVTLVLGMTPGWASARPASPPSSIDDWYGYVSSVAKRYRGRIVAYEVWNEADIGYYAGTVEQLVALTRAANAALAVADPGALLLSPSMVLRDRGMSWLTTFARHGGFRWVDVVSVHGYPHQRTGPEKGLALVEKARNTLAAEGVRKPIWNTETNYETNVAAPQPLTGAEQAAYVARTYLLSWAQGVGQVGWYDWSTTGNIGVRMARNGTAAPSPSGKAFTVVRRWMAGDVQGYRVTRRGVYLYRIVYPDGSAGVVKWHPDGPVLGVVPRHATNREGMFGIREPVTGGQRIRIGKAPVLYRIP